MKQSKYWTLDLDKILDFNHDWKSDKTPYIIYADFESLIKK